MQQQRTGRIWPGIAAVLAVGLMAAPASAQLDAGAAAMGPAPAMPVVVELYTSQGCAACPPADRMLAALARRSDVIALALHVDYWDYIGWADTFALPGHTERQKRYARAHGMSTIFTPQAVVMGTDLIEGFRVAEIEALIAAHRSAPPEVRLTLARGPGGTLQIRGEALAPPVVVASRAPEGAAGLTLGDAPALRASAAHDVQLVRILPSASVEITAGENAGLRVEYVNIVTDWQHVGHWDLRAPLALDLPLAGDAPAVVLVQAPGQGAIVGAARLD